MLMTLKNFMVKNYLWIILALFTLLFIWLNPVLFLDYIRVIRWPLVILVVIGFFKKEISILTTEKLKSFFIKAGVIHVLLLIISLFNLRKTRVLLSERIYLTIFAKIVCGSS